MALATRNEILEEGRPTNLDFNSPSVGILSQRFSGPGKYRVLDLGAPAKSTVALFSERPCTYYVEDFNRFFIAPQKNAQAEDEGRNIGAAIGAALSYDSNVRFDLVLGWDLFSYMQRAVIELLMSRIARSCRPGTLLFLATPTGPVIPSVPARITLGNDGRLRYASPVTEQSISNPRFSPMALENMMPGFRLLHSFLLGDHMQEFLFSYT
jgi:hypothetical protein